MAQEFYNEVIAKVKRSNMKEKVDPKDSHVLVIYTGGTIGMKQSSKGYVPCINTFADALRQNPRFHDLEEHQRRLSSIFDSPVLATSNENSLPSTISSTKYTEDNLITPKSYFNKRIIYKLFEMPVILESSSMQLKNWLEIGEIIEKNYSSYDGFLILHGTDTMAYTASILSFIMENLQKPVIITGSQIPYFEPRTDAEKNLLEALQIAGHFDVHEVCVFFDTKLFRGNRSIKLDNNGFDSFNSPNCSYLIKTGITYKIKWDIIRHNHGEDRFNLHKNLESNINILHFSPIITLQNVRAVAQEPTKAVIILSYGGGNIPSNRPEILQEIRNAVDRGVIFVNITQCRIGGTSSDYECGRVLKEAGVVFGCDMTLECTLAKLSYLIGKYPGQPETIKRLFRENLRGELNNDNQRSGITVNIENIMDSIGNILGLYTHVEKKQVANKCLTMLTHSAVFEGHINDLEKMADENISLELKDHNGNSPLHVACQNGNLNLVSFLLSRGVKVNPINLAGNTPLVTAIQKNFVEISEKLIENGAKISDNTEKISNLLLKAARHGHLDKIRLLQKAGINVNLCDFQGRTAAHAAVIRNQSEVIRYLIRNTNFDWKCKDVLGFTPLDIAEKLKIEEIVNLLKGHS